MQSDLGRFLSRQMSYTNIYLSQCRVQPSLPNPGFHHLVIGLLWLAGWPSIINRWSSWSGSQPAQKHTRNTSVNLALIKLAFRALVEITHTSTHSLTETCVTAAPLQHVKKCFLKFPLLHQRFCYIDYPWWKEVSISIGLVDAREIL